MAKKEDTPGIPALPIGCIDADALHAACKSGETPENALKAALVVNDEATPATPAEPEVAAAIPVDQEGAE